MAARSSRAVAPSPGGAHPTAPSPTLPEDHPEQAGARGDAASTTPPGKGVRTRGRWWRWTLRTRLVVSGILLIAVVGAVISAVTTIALHSYLLSNLDKQLLQSLGRSVFPHGPQSRGSLDFVAQPGQQIGTVGGQVGVDGHVSVGARNIEAASRDPDAHVADLTSAQVAALDAVPRDGRPHSATLPGLGDYRVQASLAAAPQVASGGAMPGGAVVVGLPLRGVEDTVGKLIVVEVCVTAAGLVAAGLTCTVMVGLALQPLRRVAATATRVSELPLHSGEVALHERVPDTEADRHTEVGQVGAALNRMLGHVASALAARQDSETRVRQFVADASHELRTPLASIRGYAELTRRGDEPMGPRTRHALGRVESEAERMTGLVEDLLLLARLDAGRPLSREATDLAPLVVDTVSDARAAGPDHAWRLRLPDTPVLVHADAARLHQVLVNLLANARTHTPPGTTVTAGLRPEGARVRLEVEDDGPGIPPALLPHVFERFARGDASRSRAAGSTGLGLAIVHAVVAAHGGEVSVASVPGRTVFTVVLPVNPHDVVVGEAAAS